MTFGYAAQVVILDDQGRIAKVVAAHDVGRAINPVQCAQQIEGAIHMGIGYALTEDLPCEAAGRCPRACATWDPAGSGDARGGGDPARGTRSGRRLRR